MRGFLTSSCPPHSVTFQAAVKGTQTATDWESNIEIKTSSQDFTLLRGQLGLKLVSICSKAGVIVHCIYFLANKTMEKGNCLIFLSVSKFT